MEIDRTIYEYTINIFGGVLIGIAVLGQFFMSASIGKVTRYDSTARKAISYAIRIGAAIMSFAALIFVIRIIRSSTTVTPFSVLAIATALVVTIVFGWKKLTSKQRNSDKGSEWRAE